MRSDLHTFDVSSRVGLHGGHGAAFAARAARERERGRPSKLGQSGPGYEDEEEEFVSLRGQAKPLEENKRKGALARNAVSLPSLSHGSGVRPC